MIYIHDWKLECWKRHNKILTLFKLWIHFTMKRVKKKPHHEGYLSHRPQSRCLSNPTLHSCQTPNETIKENSVMLSGRHSHSELVTLAHWVSEPLNRLSDCVCKQRIKGRTDVSPDLHEVCSGRHVSSHVSRHHRVKSGPRGVVTGWNGEKSTIIC